MCGKHAPDYIFVNLDSECFVQRIVPDALAALAGSALACVEDPVVIEKIRTHPTRPPAHTALSHSRCPAVVHRCRRMRWQCTCNPDAAS
jgi:hypothetical protein